MGDDQLRRGRRKQRGYKALDGESARFGGVCCRVAGSGRLAGRTGPEGLTAGLSSHEPISWRLGMGWALLGDD